MLAHVEDHASRPTSRRSRRSGSPGVLIITVLRVGFGIMGIDPAYWQIVYGTVLAIAVTLTIDRSKLASIK